MTILPHKPKPKISQVDKNNGQDVEVASPSDVLNRPSTSRALPGSSNGSLQASSLTNPLSGLPSGPHDVVDRRLVKNLKRASATPPPNTIKKGSKKLSEQQSQVRQEGCNSEDEYQAEPNNEDLNPAALLEREIQFERLMKEKGFSLRRMAEDGGCLFRAVADQVYGDQRWHDVVRRQCVDHMEKNRDYYSAFVTEEFDEYLKRKRRPDCFGNNVEIQALSEIYGRPVEIYRYSTEPINIFQTSTPSSYPPLRLSYHNRSHYNSLASPYEASVGVGLGLPGYQPGIADRNLMHEATLISENCEIEKAMLEDKLRETDWEKTQEALEKQVARESYMQWVREQEERLLGGESCAQEGEQVGDIPSTSSTSLHQETGDRPKQKTPSPSHASADFDLLASGPCCSRGTGKSGAVESTQNLPPSFQDTPISWEDWIVDDTSEEEIMLAVMARSQEDYINSFANCKTNRLPQNSELPSSSSSSHISSLNESASIKGASINHSIKSERTSDGSCRNNCENEAGGG